jgi:hypothetical protein
LAKDWGMRIQRLFTAALVFLCAKAAPALEISYSTTSFRGITSGYAGHGASLPSFDVASADIPDNAFLQSVGFAVEFTSFLSILFINGPTAAPTVFTGNARFIYDFGNYFDFIKPTVTHIKPFTSNPVLPNNQGTANVADSALLQFGDSNLARYLPGFSGEVQGVLLLGSISAGLQDFTPALTPGNPFGGGIFADLIGSSATTTVTYTYGITSGPPANVPDGGSNMFLLGLGILGLAGFRLKMSHNLLGCPVLSRP